MGGRVAAPGRRRDCRAVRGRRCRTELWRSVRLTLRPATCERTFAEESDITCRFGEPVVSGEPSRGGVVGKLDRGRPDSHAGRCDACSASTTKAGRRPSRLLESGRRGPTERAAIAGACLRAKTALRAARTPNETRRRGSMGETWFPHPTSRVTGHRPRGDEIASSTMESTSIAFSSPAPLPSRSRYTPMPPRMSEASRSSAPRSATI